jgi:hypothetical protein
MALTACPIRAPAVPISSLAPLPQPSFSSHLRRQQSDKIPHRSLRMLTAFVVDSDATRWPRRPFMVPPSLLQVLDSSYFAAKRRNHRRPKITSARSSSSRSSAMVLDSPDLVEHTIGLPSPCRSLSTPSSVPEATRASRLGRDLAAGDLQETLIGEILSLTLLDRPISI